MFSNMALLVNVMTGIVTGFRVLSKENCAWKKLTCVKIFIFVNNMYTYTQTGTMFYYWNCYITCNFVLSYAYYCK